MADKNIKTLKRGLLIIIEGIDGAGKTTQVKLLAEYFRKRGYLVSTFKEPTDGQYGRLIKEISKNGRKNITPKDELELFIKDRKEDIKFNIKPSLDKKEIVIVDRYYFSNIAYQGALGLNTEDIRAANEKISIAPDIVVILDCDVNIGLNRIKSFRNEKPNHFEEEKYLNKVRKIFKNIHGPNIKFIDSSASIEIIFNQLKKIIEDIMLPLTVDKA